MERVHASLEAVRAVCRGETGRGLPTLETPGQRFGWLTASRSTVVQPGPGTAACAPTRRPSWTGCSGGSSRRPTRTPLP